MTRYAPRRSNKAGGVALNVLLFAGGAVVILVFVICVHKNFDPQPPAPASSGSSAANTAENTTSSASSNSGSSGTSGSSEADYIKRGLLPNKGPRVSGNDNETVKVSTPVARGFIGDEYKVYHKPDCKRVKYIEPGKGVSFATAADAFSKGYIPCKICSPEIPEGVAVIPTRQPPDSKTVKPPSHPAPVSVPVKDVSVPFPYEVVGRDPINEKGVLRIEYEVNVLKPLSPDDVLLLAQKLVYQETVKGPINAVSLLVHTDRNKTTVRWLSMIDWAPYGILTRAGEVKAGDYTSHRFSIYDQATFKPKK